MTGDEAPLLEEIDRDEKTQVSSGRINGEMNQRSYTETSMRSQDENIEISTVDVHGHGQDLHEDMIWIGKIVDLIGHTAEMSAHEM